MKRLILAAAVTAMLSPMSGVVLADEEVVNDEMPRRAAGSTSGSGHTVEGNCPTDPSGNDWQGATANLKIVQVGEQSEVQVRVKDAVPNTHFTVWMRIKGGAGFNDAGSPWTGGGATPLCSGTEHADLNSISPWNNPAGDTEPHCNSFYTGNNGAANFKTTVNFPVVGGAYPFQQSGGAQSRPGAADLIPDVPTAIVDPRTGTGGPFMLRVISHCTDQATHGLSPATREAWFQFP
jgi:hypothetical protein